MASNGKQTKGNEPKVQEPVVEAVAAPVESPAPAPEPEPVAVMAPTVFANLSSESSKSATAGFSTAFDASFDTSKWTQKSLDMWNENATAIFEFTDKVAKAKTLDEVTQLQTRFFSERLDAILKQSGEMLTLAQQMMNLTIAPFYGAKAA